MLTIDPPFYQVRGVTIFRDHVDRQQFYYLPSVPELVRDPRGHTMTLYKYRRDVTDNPALDPTRARGAGLALFEVEMPLARRVLVEAELASLTGERDARLTPVLFRAGHVSVILAHNEGGELVEDAAYHQRAPLTAPHRAAFSVALSAEGATLFEQAALGGQLPVGVAYEMRFLALTPSLQARAWMNYERMYDRFSASVGFSYYVSAKLDLDLQWLKEQDLVRIEVTSFTDDADRERQEALVMNLLKARIQSDFFRSGIPPKQEPGLSGPLADLLGGLLGGSDISSASALFVLKAKLEVVREEKELELTFDSRAAVELTHVATGLLQTMSDPDDPDAPGPIIHEIDLDDEFFSVLTVRVSSVIDFREMPDLREAHVHVVKDGHRKPLSFRAGDEAAGEATFTVPLTTRGDDEYEYSVEYHFDAAAGEGPSRIAAGPFRSRSRVLVVDPLQHIRYRRLQLLLGPVDPDLVPRVHAQVRVPGGPEEDDVSLTTVRLSAEAGTAMWRQRVPRGPAPIRILVRPDWEDRRGEVHRAREVEATGDSFVALGPYRDVLDVTVLPGANWEDVTQLLVEVSYRDGDHLVERQLTFTPDRNDGATVSIPLLDPRRRTYQWRQIVFRSDGTTGETAWQDGDGRLLLVGGEDRPREVRVVWVGAAGDALGLRVDFRVTVADGAEERKSVFLQPGETDVRVSLPLDANGRLAYRFEVTRFTSSGASVLQSGASETDLLVVQSAG
jgi:hypothetical protein